MKATAEQLEANRARYMARKLSGLCVDCSAGLQEDDGVRCVECRERAQAAVLNHRKNNKARYAEYNARVRAKDPEAHRAKEREIYLDHKMRGICVKCTLPALDDTILCAAHRAKRRESALASWHRRNGTPTRAKRTATSWTKVRELAAVSAQPVKLDVFRELRAVEILESARYRLLSALRFLDWPMLSEILDAAGLSTWEGDRKQYDASVHMVTRFVRDGLATRRASRGHYEYEITAAGVAAVRDAQAETRRAA